MTRGGLSPFAAVLGVDEDRNDFTDVAGAVVPRQAWAALIRVDVVLVADGPVELEYVVRVRDHRDPDLVHPLLLEAPAGEIVTFEPVPVTLPEAAPGSRASWSARRSSWPRPRPTPSGALPRAPTPSSASAPPASSARPRGTPPWASTPSSAAATTSGASCRSEAGPPSETTRPPCR